MMKLPIVIYLSKDNKITTEWTEFAGTKYILAIGHPPAETHKSEIEEIQYVGKHDFTITYQNIHTGDDINPDLLKCFLSGIIDKIIHKQAITNKQIIDTLNEAKTTIYAFHGENGWDLYQNSPEMKKINSTIEKLSD